MDVSYTQCCQKDEINWNWKWNWNLNFLCSRECYWIALCHLRVLFWHVKIMCCVCLSVGNYAKPTADGKVEGTDILVGTGILNCLNIYVQETTVNAPYFSADNSRFWCRVSSVVHKRFLSKLQFAGLTYTGWCYCYHILSCPERDQNCLYSALAELENWLKASKHTKLNHMCHKQ